MLDRKGNPRESATLGGIVLAGFIVRLLVIFQIGSIQEDALITFRYSLNIWNGNGFVFNVGERVLGATSPLWTLTLSPIVGLLAYGAAAKVVALIGLLAFVGIALVGIRLSDFWSFGFASRVVLLAFFAFHPNLVGFSVSGMETPVFVLLCLLSLYALCHRKYFLSSLFAGLCILARPEGIIWTGCLVVFLAVTERRVPWRECLVVFIVLVPWVAFATFYFGSPLPQSVLAKSNWISQEITLVGLFWRPESLYGKWIEFSGVAVESLSAPLQALGGITWTCLFAGGFILASRRGKKELVLLGVFFVAYVLFYYFGNARVFEWYWFPGIIAGGFLFSFAFGIVMDEIANRFASHGQKLGAFIRAAAVFAFCMGLIGISVYKMNGFSVMQAYEDRVRRPTGEYLAECSAGDARVMLEPIGYIGFFSGRYIIDLAGLVTPQFAKLSDKQKPGWVVQKIREIRPEYIVLRYYELPMNRFFASAAPLFSEESDRNWMETNYIADRKFGTETEEAMVVYRRSDVVPACH